MVDNVSSGNTPKIFILSRDVIYLKRIFSRLPAVYPHLLATLTTRVTYINKLLKILLKFFLSSSALFRLSLKSRLPDP